MMFIYLWGGVKGVTRWHLTYVHIQIVLTSTQKVDTGIPVRLPLWFKLKGRESGVPRTTGNIGTTPFLEYFAWGMC